MPRADRARRARAARATRSTAPSSRGCARAWRTTGWARRPACSTSWPRSTASPTRALLHRLPHARGRAGAAARSATGGWWCSTPASATSTRAPATTSAAPSARGPASCSASSRCATPTRAALERLPEPLRRRARHVLGENERVRAAVAALRADDLPSSARCSTPRTQPARPLRGLHARGRGGRRALLARRRRRRAHDRRRLRRQRARPVRARRAAARAALEVRPGAGAHLLAD